MEFLINTLYRRGYLDGRSGRRFNLKYIYSAEYSRGFEDGRAKLMGD